MAFVYQPPQGNSILDYLNKNKINLQPDGSTIGNATGGVFTGNPQPGSMGAVYGPAKPANLAVPTASTTLPAPGYATASTQDSPYAYGPNPQPAKPSQGSVGGSLAPAAPFVPNWAQTPPPDSMAGATPWAYQGKTPEEIARENAANAILENTGQVTDAEQIYQDKLRAQQSEIDATNKLYNDMLIQSRINNAPEYLRRANATAALAVNQGLTGSNVGQGMENQTQTANMQEQAAAEALIEERRQQAIANIKGEIRKSAEAEAVANLAAKRSGAEAILANIKSRASQRQDTATKAIKGLLAAGVNVEKMTPAEKKSYLDGIGISESDWNGLAAELTKANAAEKTKAQQDAAELAYKQSQTAKNNADIANWGKMTEYQRAQIAIENYKAHNPGANEQKTNELGNIAADLTPSTKLPDGSPVLDQNNKLTPAAYEYMVDHAPQKGLTKQDILKSFGHFLYKDPKTGYSAYNLTGADEKVLTSVSPE